MGKPPTLRKQPSSSFFSKLARQKPSQTTSRKRTHTDEDDHFETPTPLQDVGIVTSLPPKATSQDVLSLMRHAQASKFDPIPERAGMNSVRIAETLNYRARLPPIVTLAHIYALALSATEVDREVARLARDGVVRQTSVLGRGRGIAPVGQGLVLVSDWIKVVEASQLEATLQEKYIRVMRENPTAVSVAAILFTASEVTALVNCGFMTFGNGIGREISLPGLQPSIQRSVSDSGALATTGTYAAVGGRQAVHDHGGGGKGLSSTTGKVTGSGQNLGNLTFALPCTGTYLALLTDARQHMIELLSKASPKFKESTRDLLRERWNGGILTDDAPARAKRARGEFVGVSPGSTKKWRKFHGLNGDWVFEELLGSGLVECFETGSVGLGARISRH